MANCDEVVVMKTERILATFLGYGFLSAAILQFNEFLFIVLNALFVGYLVGRWSEDDENNKIKRRQEEFFL